MDVLLKLGFVVRISSQCYLWSRDGLKVLILKNEPFQSVQLLMHQHVGSILMLKLVVDGAKGNCFMLLDSLIYSNESYFMSLAHVLNVKSSTPAIR